jgi:hypothetical protein
MSERESAVGVLRTARGRETARPQIAMMGAFGACRGRDLQTRTWGAFETGVKERQHHSRVTGICCWGFDDDVSVDDR